MQVGAKTVSISKHEGAALPHLRDVLLLLVARVVLRGDGCVATRFGGRGGRAADDYGTLAVWAALAVVAAHATLGAFALNLGMVAGSLGVIRAAPAALCTARATALSAAILLLHLFGHPGLQLLQLFQLLLHGLEVSLGLVARLLGLLVLLLRLFRVLFCLLLVASGTPGKHEQNSSELFTDTTCREHSASHIFFDFT
jgi:hypothetical protein